MDKTTIEWHKYVDKTNTYRMFASKMRISNFQLVEISLSIFHKAVASVVPSPSWMSILFTDSIVSSISLKLLQL